MTVQIFEVKNLLRELMFTHVKTCTDQTFILIRIDFHAIAGIEPSPVSLLDEL